MKVLIVGSGGREHAIAWAVNKSSLVDNIYLTKNNAGIEYVNSIDIDPLDNRGLLNFALKNEIDLTIVGPEAALLNGIVDLFNKHNLKIFGPTKKASIIEGSKEYAKKLMQEYNVPTANYKVFDSYESAVNYVKTQDLPIVIKYDGLALGKGVVIAHSMDEAINTLKDMLLNNKYGEGSVLIEEFLTGPEFSLMAFVNGENVYPMEIAQDHKRAFDGDQGPNTGGMGAYSPVSIIPKQAINEAVEKIMKPIAKALVDDNRSFQGVLYGGLILTKDGPKVIEFNARFGDPETEVVLLRLENDLVKVILDVMNNIDPLLTWTDKSALGVVIASKGYPYSYEKGFCINGIDQKLIFQMGTTYSENNYKTNGGRVLFVAGMGESLLKAREEAYKKISKIDCENLFYRRDIGYQVINKEGEL